MIKLLLRSLQEKYVEITTLQSIVTNKYVRFPAPVKAPLAIDVIRLLYKYLYDHSIETRHDVAAVS